MIVDENRPRRLLACLGDPSRFRVISKLVTAQYCVTDLAREIGLSQSCTTRHLQALQKEGLVAGLRIGKRVMFRLRTEEPMVAGLVAWALSHQEGSLATSAKNPEPMGRRQDIDDFLL